MNPKHLIKALAIAYIQDNGGRILISAERLLELQRAGEISFRDMNGDNKIFMVFFEEKK